MDTKALKKQMGAAIAMVLVAAIALGAATFAWFVNNTKVTADGLTTTAKSANTLLISHDGTAWGTSAKFGATDPLTDFVPTSTTDAKTFYKDKAWTTEASGEYNASEFEVATEGTDYYADTFKIKASQDCGLYIDDGTEITTTGNANVLKAMRLALVVDNKAYFYQVDANPIAGDGNAYNTTLKQLDANGISKAISGENAASPISAANLSSGNVTSLADGEVTKPGSSTELVNANDAKKLCDLKANTVKEVKVYVWMEGCDYDCNSTVVKQITEQAVKVSLEFCAGKNSAA